MNVLPQVKIAQFKSTESVTAVKSIIGKFAKVEIGTGTALHIKAAMMGFKDYDTLKGLSSNKFYFSAKANVGSDKKPMFIEIPLGYFDHVAEALDETKEKLESLDVNMEFRLYMDDIDAGFYLPYQKACEYDVCEDEIDGNHIEGVVFEEVDHQIVDREDAINDLYSYISETRSCSDRELMISDLDFLKSIKDEYVFSSMSTNNFIAYSVNETQFNELCERVLEAME